MPGHDWEALYGQLERATKAWTRDELVGLLRDLIREYVIERGLPTGSAAQAATPDLATLDFPGLITWLKRASSVPELDLFQVDGRRVIVDADGPRELSLARATETRPRPAPRSARRPAPPPQRAPRADTLPARPQVPTRASEPPADQGDESKQPQRALSKGFRGLEFD